MERNTSVVPRVESGRVQRFLRDGTYPHVTREEVYELYAAADGAELRLLLQLLWVTGGRISEVLALRARDLLRPAMGSYQLNMPRMKRRRTLREVLPVPAECGTAIASFLELTGRANDDPLIDMARNTAWRKVRALGQEVLDKRVTPHMFRHGRVYDLARERVHPFVIAKVVGHTDISTTMGYFHPTEQDILEAMEK